MLRDDDRPSSDEENDDGKKPQKRHDDDKGQDDKEADDKDGDEKQDDKNDKDGDKKDKPKSRLPIVILIAAIVLLVGGGTAYWLLTRGEQSTDDAYTEGNAVSIAPKISGYVVERRINDNTIVHTGDLLLRIDPRDYLTARDQARANLALARAQLASASPPGWSSRWRP